MVQEAECMAVRPLSRVASSDEVKLESLCMKQRLQQDYYKGSSDISAGGLSRSKRFVERERLTPDAHGVVVALVGLPARGKSFISRKLERFLEWRGFPTQTFNVGRYRRDVVAAEESGRSDFFSTENTAALAAREAAAGAALDDALQFLSGGGKIAILDATNSTKSRRKWIVDQVHAYGRPFTVVFLEAICDDHEILEMNMQSKVNNSPDFLQMALDDAIRDLKARIDKYANVYQSVEDSEGPYIKVFDLSSKVMASNCYGRLSKTILPFMMAMHIGSRPIWLVRAGSGESNPQSPDCDRLSGLSSAGRSFADLLAAFVSGRAGRYWGTAGRAQEPISVMTSTMPRAEASVVGVDGDWEATSALNPVDKGTIGGGWWDVECHSDVPPWEDMRSRHSDFFSTWAKEPFKTRFPGGESYMDVIKRLEPVLVEIEMSTRPVLIVSHLTVLQLLLAYFRGSPVEDAWRLAVPKGTVFEVSPTSGGGFVTEEHQLRPAPAPREANGAPHPLRPEPTRRPAEALGLAGEFPAGAPKRLRTA